MKTKNIRKGLGKKSAFLLATLAENNKSLFAIEDAIAILKEKRSNIAKLLHDLAANGWVSRVSRGKYIILPLEAGAKPEYTEHEFIIASLFVQPYYISYWSALNYYGLTEQVPSTVFIATTKRMLEKNTMGSKFRFITVKKSKFFGFTKVLIDSHYVNMADREKAIIDCLDFPRNCGGIAEAIKSLDNAKEELDINKLIVYAKRMENGAILNRLGYILELLGIKADVKPASHYTILNPLGKNKGIYNKKWKIIENISKKDLLSWRGY